MLKQKLVHKRECRNSKLLPHGTDMRSSSHRGSYLNKTFLAFFKVKILLSGIVELLA